MKVELLIGANCLKALEPIEVIRSQNEGPYAFRTILGWCVVGPIEGSHDERNIKCNRIAVQDSSDQTLAKHHFEVSSIVKEQEIKGMLEKLYNNDFIEQKNSALMISNDNESLSDDENKFMKIMDEGIKKRGMFCHSLLEKNQFFQIIDLLQKDD